MPTAQDPMSAPQGHQSLPQWHRSRASLQLCLSCPQAGAWCPGLGLPCSRLWVRQAWLPVPALLARLLRWDPTPCPLGSSHPSLLPGNHMEMRNHKKDNSDFLEFFLNAKWSRPKYYLCQPQDIQRRRNNARILLPSFSKTAVLCVMATRTWKSKLMIDNIH